MCATSVEVRNFLPFDGARAQLRRVGGQIPSPKPSLQGEGTEAAPRSFGWALCTLSLEGEGRGEGDSLSHAGQASRGSPRADWLRA